MLRLALVAVAALVLAPSADAWSWPCDGQVLRAFSLADDPYAAGQHRGIDVGCGEGASVGAPTSGTVSFAGTLPGLGRGVTIQTSDGYAVTLVQLGATAVSRGDVVAEGATVGAIGDSEDPVTRAPHVHLGARVASDPQGYLDPLRFLPHRPVAAPPAAPAPPPAPVAAPVAKPAAPAAPPAAQPPAGAVPPPPAAAPVAAESPQPAAAVAAAAPLPGPVGTVEHSASSEDAEPARAADAEGAVGGLEVIAGASGEPVSTSRVAAHGGSPDRTADAPRRVFEPRRATPTAADVGGSSASGRPTTATISAATYEAAPRVRPRAGPADRGAPPARVVVGERREPLVRIPPADGSTPIPRWSLVASLLVAAAAVILWAARIMTGRVSIPVPAEDPGGAGVAVRERTAPHRPCGGVRSARRHLRAVPPSAGRRRPHGLRHGRARHARDGDRRPGRAFAA
jgi:hypothetical protein